MNGSPRKIEFVGNRLFAFANDIYRFDGSNVMAPEIVATSVTDANLVRVINSKLLVSISRNDDYKWNLELFRTADGIPMSSGVISVPRQPIWSMSHSTFSYFPESETLWLNLSAFNYDQSWSYALGTSQSDGLSMLGSFQPFGIPLGTHEVGGQWYTVMSFRNHVLDVLANDNSSEMRIVEFLDPTVFADHGISVTIADDGQTLLIEDDGHIRDCRESLKFIKPLRRGCCGGLCARRGNA